MIFLFCFVQATYDSVNPPTFQTSLAFYYGSKKVITNGQEAKITQPKTHSSLYTQLLGKRQKGDLAILPAGFANISSWPLKVSFTTFHVQKQLPWTFYLSLFNWGLFHLILSLVTSLAWYFFCLSTPIFPGAALCPNHMPLSFHLKPDSTLDCLFFTLTIMIPEKPTHEPGSLPWSLMRNSVGHWWTTPLPVLLTLLPAFIKEELTVQYTGFRFEGALGWDPLVCLPIKIHCPLWALYVIPSSYLFP